MTQNTELGQLAHIAAGYSFRGRLDHEASGLVIAVQMKDVIGGQIAWQNAVRLTLPGRSPSMWIEAGDIAIISRGNNHAAVLLDKPPMPAVLTPFFFHIRLNQPNQILPRFLAWQMNQITAQNHFARSAEGSDVRHLRRSILEATPILIPPLAEQHLVIKWATIAEQRRIKLTQLINSHDTLESALGRDLLNRWTKESPE